MVLIVQSGFLVPRERSDVSPGRLEGGMRLL